MPIQQLLGYLFPNALQMVKKRKIEAEIQSMLIKTMTGKAARKEVSKTKP